MAKLIVYVATNLINGHCYVGFSRKSIEERRHRHENSARAKRVTCRRFHEAIRSYGPEAFDWKVLISCETLDEALREEVRIIEAIRPEYNLTAGGQGSHLHKMSTESKAKLSAAMKGRRYPQEVYDRGAEKHRGLIRTPEQRERMGAARRGKPFSDAHRKALSLALKGRPRAPRRSMGAPHGG